MIINYDEEPASESGRTSHMLIQPKVIIRGARSVFPHPCSTLRSCLLLQRPATFLSIRMLPDFSVQPKRTTTSGASGGLVLNSLHCLIFACQPHSLYSVHFKCTICFWNWPVMMAFTRRCCCTITWSLWIKRYDVCTFSLVLITSEMIRSSGSGRLLSAFHTAGYILITSLSLEWRLPKIIFIINRYIITLLLLYVV